VLFEDEVLMKGIAAAAAILNLHALRQALEFVGQEASEELARILLRKPAVKGNGKVLEVSEGELQAEEEAEEQRLPQYRSPNRRLPKDCDGLDATMEYTPKDPAVKTPSVEVTEIQDIAAPVPAFLHRVSWLEMIKMCHKLDKNAKELARTHCKALDDAFIREPRIEEK
jgi:hypothetical protein